jgi:hypothetical protein
VLNPEIVNDRDTQGDAWKFRLAPTEMWSPPFDTEREAQEALREEQEEAERERYRQRGTYVVAVYAMDRCYGGPEEGGWWYDAGTLVRVLRVVKGLERASEIAGRVNRLLKHRRRTLGRAHYGNVDINSVCYQGGHLRACVYERTAPESFPESRPFYE